MSPLSSCTAALAGKTFSPIGVSLHAPRGIQRPQHGSKVKNSFLISLTYQNKLWLGTNYRTSGDIGVLLGYSIGNRYLIGYSYDMISSNLGDYTSGSHEFVLGIKFAPVSEEQITK